MAFGDKPQSLGDVLQDLIEKMGLQHRIDGARVVEAWAFVAGPQVNAVTDNAWYRKGKLYVRIRSAAWRHELHLRRNEWLRRVNEELGRDIVQEIVFR